MARSVAFLDILGFKRKLELMPLAEIANAYETAISRVQGLNQRQGGNPKGEKFLKTHKAGDSWCHISVFSDSIILISLDETDDSFLKLILYTRKLFIYLLDAGFAVRGGVSSGELYHNPKLSVTLGKALTNAYVLESRQDWCGVSIDPICWEHFPKIGAMVNTKNHPFDIYFMEFPVPWKDGTHSITRIINWRINIVHHKGSIKLLEDTGLRGAQTKWTNTVGYLNALRNAQAMYFAQDYEMPQECPTIWIGPVRPPFDHGDEY